jgi:hypothetical protein
MTTHPVSTASTSSKNGLRKEAPAGFSLQCPNAIRPASLSRIAKNWDFGSVLGLRHAAAQLRDAEITPTA